MKTFFRSLLSVIGYAVAWPMIMLDKLDNSSNTAMMFGAIAAECLWIIAWIWFFVRLFGE